MESPPHVERIRSVRCQKRKPNVVIQRKKISFLGLYALLTGLWEFKDILNSHQNRSKINWSVKAP